LFSGQRRGIIGSRFIRSSPDTDTYGGGVRDNRLVNLVKVFAETLMVHVRKFFPGAESEVECLLGGDTLSCKLSMNVFLGDVVFKGCFLVKGVLNSERYSLEVFSESFGEVTLMGLNMRLAVRVALLIESKWKKKGGV
jgi:hypothetical protein